MEDYTTNDIYVGDNTITVDVSNMASSAIHGYSGLSTSLTGNYNVTSGSILAAGTTYSYVTTPSNSSSLEVSGDANFQGDLKIKGVSIADSLKAIEKRLSILTPNPKKLAKYEALQKAYAHYKTLEAMCDEDDEENGHRPT